MGATDSDKERTPKMSNPSFVQEAVEMAATKLEEDASKAHEEGQVWERQAQELYRRARNLRMDVRENAGANDGRGTVSDWTKAKRADAMHDYLRQFPIGQRVKISEVVAALTRGGVNVAGNFRPDQRNYQKEAERNLFITASRNDEIYEYDKKAREIWRK
jgi:hypothetical protein